MLKWFELLQTTQTSVLLNVSPKQNMIPSNSLITFLLQSYRGRWFYRTPGRAPSDFCPPWRWFPHTYSRREKKRMTWGPKITWTRTWAPSRSHACAGLLLFAHPAVRLKKTLMIKHQFWLKERALGPAGEDRSARVSVWERVHIYTCTTLACSLQRGISAFIRLPEREYTQAHSRGARGRSEHLYQVILCKWI